MSQSHIFSQAEGLALIVGFGLMISLGVWVLARSSANSKTAFLVANRDVGRVPMAFSVAAAWIWAPALFVSAEKAYTQGWVGLFWFVIPNVSCLVLFSFFAAKLRDRFPSGFTLSGYMRNHYSERVQGIYLVAFVGLATCSFAVQLLAGGKVIASLSGLPFPLVTVMLALVPIGYSFYSGLKASIVSDYLQMAVMLVICPVILVWSTYAAGGVDVLFRGLQGRSGTYDSLWSGAGLDVLFTFGIPVTIGLLSGPFGDQSFWQRSFAAKKESVQSSFMIGALLFAIVPITLSGLGFLAAGMKLDVANTGQVNLLVVSSLLPEWAMVPFVYLLLAGLVSTLDSNLTAISSLAGHDLEERFRRKGASPDTNALLFSRGAMLFLLIVGIAIANIPGLTILHLFLFYGTLRASTLLPTILTLTWDNLSEEGVFYGIIVSLCVGLPIFAYGNINKITSLILAGSLTSVLSSGVIAILLTRFRSQRGTKYLN
jgi:Na+/proline symporter